MLAKALATMKEFILCPEARFAHVVRDRVDVGMWTVGARTLVLATNLNYEAKEFDLRGVEGLEAKTLFGTKQVLDSGAMVRGHVISLESVGTGGFIIG